MTKILLGITAVLFLLGLTPLFSPEIAKAGGAIFWFMFWSMVGVDLIWLMGRAMYKYIHSD
jgi:hypothetical protein